MLRSIPGQDRAGADFYTVSTPSAFSWRTGFGPAYGVGHLPRTGGTRLDAGVNRLRLPVVDEGNAEITKLDGVEIGFEAFLRGLHDAQWKGALTGSRMARLAPAALASSHARLTAASWPAMTIWSGELRLAALNHFALRGLGEDAVERALG